MAINGELQSKTTRAKLEVRSKPHWQIISKGLHLGYRRLDGQAGTWCCRHYTGKGDSRGYSVERIGVADDYSPADGKAVLSHAEALEEARKRMVKHADGGQSEYTIRQCIADYLDDREVNDGKSVADTRRRADYLINSRIGDVCCATLNEATLKSWMRNLVKEPARYKAAPKTEEERRKRRATVNRIWTVLHASLTYAFEEEKIASNAAWVKIKQFKNADAARVRWLTMEEVGKFLAACDPEFKPIATAALLTGCRYGELCRLTVGDFSPNRATLQILVTKSGKPRDLFLSDEAAKFFRTACQGRDHKEPIFVRNYGGPWGKSHQHRFQNQACERAGIEPITYHGHRHTFASHAVMSGMPLTVLARHLGHRDTKMVEKHYGHLCQDFVAKTIREHTPTFGVAAA